MYVGPWLKPLTAAYVSITATGHNLLLVLPIKRLMPQHVGRSWNLLEITGLMKEAAISTGGHMPSQVECDN